MEPLVDLLESLIAIPSLTGHEEGILDALERRFTESPSDRRSLWQIERHREGLVVTTRPRRGDARKMPLVVMAGHVDTVAPQGDPGPRLDGDVMWGLGASDMKSGLAVMTHLGLALEVWRLPVRLALVYYTGEEGAFEKNGLGPILEKTPFLREAHLAILLEPTANAVELGCLGTLNVEVQVPGLPCHSARPWLGRSALSAAAPWILEMSRITPRDRLVAGLAFKETMVITRLKAGSGRNVLPGSLVANVNIRYAPDREEADVLDAFARGLLADWTWNVIDHAPPGRIPQDAPLLSRFLELVEAPCRAKQGWTDVARFASLGIPAVNFGPGQPEFAHRRDEQVPLANLNVAAQCLRRFLENALA